MPQLLTRYYATAICRLTRLFVSRLFVTPLTWLTDSWRRLTWHAARRYGGGDRQLLQHRRIRISQARQARVPRTSIFTLTDIYINLLV